MEKLNFYTFYDAVKHAVSHYFDEVGVWFDETKELRNYKPTNGGWSIDEILEHISLTNHYLLILINKGKEKALKKTEEVNLDDIDYSNDSLLALEEIGEHKSFPWPRPEHMEPTGKVHLAEVRETLHKQLAQCLDTLEVLKDGKGTLAKTTMSVNDLGKIDVYEYIYFLALHSKRHIEQMTKVKNEFEAN